MKKESVKKSLETSKNVLEEKRKMSSKKFAYKKTNTFTTIAMNFVQEQLKNWQQDSELTKIVAVVCFLNHCRDIFGGSKEFICSVMAIKILWTHLHLVPDTLVVTLSIKVSINNFDHVKISSMTKKINWKSRHERVKTVTSKEVWKKGRTFPNKQTINKNQLTPDELLWNDRM